MRKYFIFLLVSLFLISFVSAAPPFESDPSAGLTFSPSTFASFKEGMNYNLHVHVINGTEIQTPLTTSCFVHLYDISGSHTLESGLGWDSNGLEFKLDIDGGNQTLGEHAYILQCNNTGKEIHMVKGSYTVTKSGRSQPDGVLLVFFIIFSMVMFFTLLWSLYKILDDFTQVNVTIKTVFIGFTAYISNLAYYYFALNFMPWDLLLDISLMGMSAFGVTHLFLPLVGLVFTWIKNRGVE